MKILTYNLFNKLWNKGKNKLNFRIKKGNEFFVVNCEFRKATHIKGTKENL